MVDRLFEIVYILMEKEKVTAKELAQRFEVSERTIFRDVERLSLAGIPIYMVKGKGGGIHMLSDYVLDKTLLTQKEQNEVLASLQVLKEVGYKESSALEKLESFFGNRQGNWIEVDFENWENNEEETQQFDIAKKGVLEHQYLKIIYNSAKGEKMEREIKPVKLCFRSQAWYLYAFCMLRNDFRFFKLHRIVHIELLNRHFEPIQVGQILTKRMLPTKKGVMVKLKIDAKMAFRAYDELPNIMELKNGDLCCELEVTNEEWFYSYILSYGENCEILEPEYMRKKIRNRVSQMAKRYL